MMLRSLFLLLLISVVTAGRCPKCVNDKIEEPRRWESTGIVNCTQPVFTCSDDSYILPLFRRCDGMRQCSDGSDEKNCTECLTPFSFKTADGFLNCYTAAQLRTKKADEEYDRRYHSTNYKCNESEQPKLWANWTSNCTDGEFRCSTEAMCLPATSKCDGENDCVSTGSHYDCNGRYAYYSYDVKEEGNCTECHNGAKKCKANGKCIARRNLCDGYKDCDDGSDEQDCTCETCTGTKALCGNGQCIDGWRVCDGVNDCNDGSDEQGCLKSCAASAKSADSEKCGKHKSSDTDSESDCAFGFKCSKYLYYWNHEEKCIRKSQVCDGIRDCGKGEDERNCLKACLKYPFFTRVNNMRKAKCIPMENVCDGVDDFVDRIDEKKCTKCGNGGVLCDGGCHPSSIRCDGVKDCSDGSDEKKCTCEECTSKNPENYLCETTGTCLQEWNTCYGSTSLCPKPTAFDHQYCKYMAQKKKAKSMTYKYYWW